MSNIYHIHPEGIGQQLIMHTLASVIGNDHRMSLQARFCPLDNDVLYIVADFDTVLFDSKNLEEAAVKFNEFVSKFYPDGEQ